MSLSEYPLAGATAISTGWAPSRRTGGSRRTRVDRLLQAAGFTAVDLGTTPLVENAAGRVSSVPTKSTLSSNASTRGGERHSMNSQTRPCRPCRWRAAGYL